MKIVFRLLVFFTSHLVLAVTPDCETVEYGRRICTLDSSPETMRKIGMKLFVGCEDSLEVFSLQSPAAGLQYSLTVDLSSSSRTVTDCGEEFFRAPEECRNFIRTIEDFGDGQVIVCGTNAFEPRCNLHDRDQPGTYHKLSPPDETDEGFSPHLNTRSIVALLASNNHFFSATRFAGVGSRTPIRMSSGLLQDPMDTTFTVGTPLTDPRWLNEPTFISAHEYEDHVYFFITEKAFEISSVFENNPQSFEEVVYTRAVRICKTDTGIDGEDSDPETNLFLTFEKARMECSAMGNNEFLGFSYNELQSTYLSRDSETLYGVFNSPQNGPPGGAICKFSFNPEEMGSITGVLGDTDFLVRSTNDAGNQVWERMEASPFVCPGSEGDQRSASDSEMYQLKFDPITPSQSSSSPLFVSAGEFLDKIAVETVTFLGETLEVMYFTNKQGDIKQVVRTEREAFEHTLYTNPGSADPIRDLILQSDTNGSTLFASTSNRILQIPRGQCSSYASCFECFDSGDIFCGWNPAGTGACEKFTNDSSHLLLRSFSASESTVVSQCGPRPSTPTSIPTMLPCDVEESPNTYTEKGEVTTQVKQPLADCTTAKPPPPNTAGLQNSDGNGISVGVIAGAAMAAFVLGIPVGGVVCIIFYKRLAKSSSSDGHHKKGDRSPETPPLELLPAPPGQGLGQGQVENNSNNSSTFNNSSSLQEKGGTDVKSEQVELSTSKEVSNTFKPIPPPCYMHTNPAYSSPPQPSHAQQQQPHPTNGIVPPHHIGTPPSATPSTVQANGTLGSTTMALLSPTRINKPTNSNKILTHHFSVPEVIDEDSAFAETDTVAPLKHFTPGMQYGSLGRHKTGSNGVTRKQVPGYKVPRGRTDSTTWLRQRSESLSSDISFSSGTSPLQSPISDV